MAHCEEYTQLISASLDGALPPSEQEALDAHLSACPECRAVYGELLALHDTLASMPAAQPPQGLRERIMEAGAAEADSDRPAPLAAGKKSPLRWRRWLASAAVLALAVTGAWSWRPWEGRAGSALPRSAEAAQENGGPAHGDTAATRSGPALPEYAQAGADAAGLDSLAPGASLPSPALELEQTGSPQEAAVPDLARPVASQDEAVDVLVNYIYELVGEVVPAADGPAVCFSVNSPTGASGTVICLGEDADAYLLDYQDSLSAEVFHYSVNALTGEVLLLGQDSPSAPPAGTILP